jgi:hypothetical protein
VTPNVKSSSEKPTNLARQSTPAEYVPQNQNCVLRFSNQFLDRLRAEGQVSVFSRGETLLGAGVSG